jgi:CRISPR-associated protein Cmr6
MNLNYLLNKEYYDGLTQKHFRECNDALVSRQYQIGTKELVDFSDSSVCLRTTYPGLLIGLGNAHNAKEGIKDGEDGDEIKLGFTLDYVTGLPMIPGSTVKGVLRSAFTRHPEYVANEVLQCSESAISSIEKAIFSEGSTKVAFFDAVPIAPGKCGRLFGLDNITPHPDPLKGPNPLTMLKVIPNVVFLFRFGFDRWDDSIGVSRERLKDAFKEIFIALGVGAKTNVGYGAMEELTEQEMKELLKSEDKYHFMEPDYAQSQTPLAQANAQSIDPKKPPGTCQHPGCNAKTKLKRNGEGYHTLCQSHYLQTTEKKRKKVL